MFDLQRNIRSIIVFQEDVTWQDDGWSFNAVPQHEHEVQVRPWHCVHLITVICQQFERVAENSPFHLEIQKFRPKPKPNQILLQIKVFTKQVFSANSNETAK